MKKKSIGLRSNLNKADNHEITKKEYEEIPELPKEFFTEGQLYKDGKPVSRKVRGKQKKPVKVAKTMRFDPDVIEFFQASGRGWQTRMNDVLGEYVKKQKGKRKLA